MKNNKAAIMAILLTIGIVTGIYIFRMATLVISAVLISFLGIVNKQIEGRN